MQPVHVDRDPADLAVDGLPDGIADRGIDLAGDLGYRDTEGDGDVQLDVDPVIDADGDAGRGETEPFDQATDRSAGESCDTVRTKGRRPDDITKGAARDE
jgi:hypothetical protein